jgi:hypothetical protein
MYRFLVFLVVLALCANGASAQETSTSLTFIPAQARSFIGDDTKQDPSPKDTQDQAKEQNTESSDKLTKLKEALEKLSKSANVSVAEGLNLHIFGALQGAMTYSTARAVAPGTEFYLTPASPFGLDSPNLDVHAKASYLGMAVTGPKVGDWEASGYVLFYFYSETLTTDRYGILPEQIWGDIKNGDWRFAAGLQRDIFNPLDPTMLNFAVLNGSGNAGNFRGQLRLEHYVKPTDEMQWTLQAGLSEPIATLVTNDFSISEDNGCPNIEARIALGLGHLEGEGSEAKRPFEVGLSGVVGQIRNTDLAGQRVVANVWGVGTDARWKINERFGVQGELYTGQTLGTYNGGVLQDVNTANFQGIRSSGAWAEIYYYLIPEKLHTHVGYGIDDPLDHDLAPGQRVRNDTYFANLIWDATKAFRLGAEVTWRDTAYLALRNNQGFSIQTVVQWSF